MVEARRALPQIGDFPVLTTEKTRFGDTDAFGHVNNAVINTFLESGRSELLRYGDFVAEAAGCRFVLVRVEVDYHDELVWPGEVVIASRVARIGRTSLAFDQAIYQHGVCRVLSASTLVHASAALKASVELTSEARSHFASLA